MVAEYVSKHLLTDEDRIVSLVQQNRSLGQRIHNWFQSLLAKFGNKNAQERAFINKVHWIDKKETSASIPSTDIRQRSRYQKHGMGGTQSEVYDENIAETDPNVKKNDSRQYSLSVALQLM